VKNNRIDINIGPQEAGKRRFLGAITLAIAIILAVLIAAYDLSIWWNLLLFFPLLAALIGFLQAQEKTCIALAAQNLCNLDNGVRKIEDKNLAQLLQNRANGIIYKSAALALILTALIIFAEYLTIF
jgi:hypothetical protein